MPVKQAPLWKVRKQIQSDVFPPPQSVSSSPYTVKETDNFLFIDDDAIGGAVTVNLPEASTLISGFQVMIMKIGSTGTVTIDPNGSETINGESSVDLLRQYESIRIATNSANWFIIEA